MTDITDIPILVLAAGASTRMRGRDKLLEPVAGEPLLRRQARIARGATRGPVIVALPVAPHPRYQVLAGLDVVLLGVEDAASGMGHTIATGIAAMPPAAPAAMLLLADMPELTTEDLQRVAAAVDPGSGDLIWRGATQTGALGHPIVFSAELFAELRSLSGDSGGREVVAAAKPRVVAIALPGNRALADLDTPEDWIAWRSAQEGD